MTANLVSTCGSGDGAAKLVTIRKVIAKVRPFGATDRGVEVTSALLTLLTAGAACAIAVSGGKDSIAAAIATIEFLDSIGHTGPRILIHADLGDPDPALDVEWADSLPTCQRLADRYGIELVIARRPAGGMMKRWLKRWENNKRRYANLSCVKVILPFSTPKMRFCTSELKSAPMASVLVKRFAGHTIISACGVRREESDNRENAQTTKVNNRLINKGKKTTGIDWNPIAHWTEGDVYAFCASRGFDMHAGYTDHNMDRISCVYCIMQSKADTLSSAAVPTHRPVLRTIVGLEISSTFGFKGTWLGDDTAQYLDDETRAAVADAKRRGKAREAIEKRIPKHLLYTKGWPTVMPTREEAEMLCEVRTSVAALMGFDIGYTDPDAVLARYAHLMALKAAKEAAKEAASAKKAARKLFPKKTKTPPKKGEV